MDYLNFHLAIGPLLADNQYAVFARSENAGEARSVFIPPRNDDQLENFVLKLGMRRGIRQISSPEWLAARAFGQDLFKAVFSDKVRDCFVASHNDATRQGKGLRLKLSLDAPALSNYPWEFLYDPDTARFIALFEDTPLVRYVESSAPVLPLTAEPPLRILALASSPKEYEPLDIARERRNLEEALRDLLPTQHIELDWLSNANLDTLHTQLVRKEYHIFHFIGHGGFDEQKQDGVLIFEDVERHAQRVSGERLAIILGNCRTLRLAMLNACDGARTSKKDPFAGTALTLVRTGNLPAVVAMQFAITDVAAIDFARGFYTALATGRPVDAAVGQGRQAIMAKENDVEWSTPVLYMRTPDGRIFDIAYTETKRHELLYAIGLAHHQASRWHMAIKELRQLPPAYKDAASLIASAQNEIEKNKPSAPDIPASEQQARDPAITRRKLSWLGGSIGVLLLLALCAWSGTLFTSVALSLITTFALPTNTPLPASVASTPTTIATATATSTAVPTSTPMPPTATLIRASPTATLTPRPPTATPTHVPPTATFTIRPPTNTPTPAPSTATPTPTRTPRTIGQWRNQDANTRGITRINIQLNHGTYLVETWGKCSPTDCYWNEYSGVRYSVSNVTETTMSIVWTFSFVTTDLRLEALSDGQLKVASHEHFTDNSGRSDLYYTYYFIK